MLAAPDTLPAGRTSRPPAHFNGIPTARLWNTPLTIDDYGAQREFRLQNGYGIAYPALHDDLMSHLLGIAADEHVLDIGGGDAPFRRANVVTDAFPDMNAHRSGRAVKRDGQDALSFVQCFAEELPFADKTFDVAYCRMVLEHTIDPAAACREMMRVARRGFLETPSPLAEYLGGHPTHRWIVWVEQNEGQEPTLVFRRKPFRRAPFGYLLRGAWFADPAFRFRWEWQYRNVVCTQLVWEERFSFRVEDDVPADPASMDYDNPAQAAEAHLDAALCSLRQGDVPDNIILPDIDQALEYCPDWAVAHNAKGCLLQAQSRFAEARLSFAAALRLEPDNAVYRANAALAPTPGEVHSPVLELLPAPAPLPPDAAERYAVPTGALRDALQTCLFLTPGCGNPARSGDVRARLDALAPHDVTAGLACVRTLQREEETRRQGDRETGRQGDKGKAGTNSNSERSSQPIPDLTTPDTRQPTPSLLWNAPLRDPSGYADEARHFLFALDAAGVNVAARAIRWSEKIAVLPREREKTLQRLLAQPAPNGAVQVCHILAPLFQVHPAARANVGRTMFETDRLPAGWANACNQMDAVWVPSAFNVETFAFAGVAREKLRIVPGAIDLAPYNPNCAPLRIDGARGFNFLSVFDWTRRKGWDALIRAFVEEFRADEDVALIVKTHSSMGYTGQQIMETVSRFVTETLHSDLNRIPDIVLQDANVPDERMPNLYRAADCYVMPTRGEGWGRPFMEALAMRLPVIATGWSGQTAFLNADNSYVLEYELVDVPETAWRETPTYQGHRWAEPSVTHLRRLLRQAFEDREGGKEKGETGRTHLETHFTYGPVAQIMRKELERLT